MPLKTWADYERLEAPDLNSAFAWSQDQTMPGAYSSTSGPDSASIASTAYGEVQHGAPPAGGDPHGIYQSANGRLVIPPGFGGLWLYSSSIAGFSAATAGDTMQAWININGARQGPIASCARFTGNSQNAANPTFVLTLGDGAALFLEVRMMSSAGVAACRRWSLTRLGRGLGLPGATPTVYAGTLPGPDAGEPELEA